MPRGRIEELLLKLVEDSLFEAFLRLVPLVDCLFDAVDDLAGLRVDSVCLLAAVAELSLRALVVEQNLADKARVDRLRSLVKRWDSHQLSPLDSGLLFRRSRRLLLFLFLLFH